VDMSTPARGLSEPTVSSCDERPGCLPRMSLRVA